MGSDVIRDFRSKLDREKGRRDQVKGQLDMVSKRVRILRREIDYTEQAQVIIQQVAQQTQQELEYHIGELVTLALASVFPDPYELKVHFVVRRGKTEADIMLCRNGEEVDPLTASGGGVVDIVSFALRVALWRLSPKRSQAIFVLDEPFRYLSEGLIRLAGQMLQELSSRFGLQIIMVTHSRELMECADRVFEVKQRKGVSQVSVV
jgi:chromosome segregation ATPase